MKSLIAVPFLIGSLPLLGSVAIGYNYLKSKRESNKYLFWGGMSGFIIAGCVASNMIMNRYTESLDFDAESLNAESAKFASPDGYCPGCDGRATLVCDDGCGFYRAESFSADSKTESCSCGMDNCSNHTEWMPCAECGIRSKGVSLNINTCDPCSEMVWMQKNIDEIRNKINENYRFQKEHDKEFPFYETRLGAESFSAEVKGTDLMDLKVGQEIKINGSMDGQEINPDAKLRHVREWDGEEYFPEYRQGFVDVPIADDGSISTDSQNALYYAVKYWYGTGEDITDGYFFQFKARPMDEPKGRKSFYPYKIRHGQLRLIRINDQDRFFINGLSDELSDDGGAIYEKGDILEARAYAERGIYSITPLEEKNAESKFVKPYDRRGKIDFRRDNKGRYRRKLSIPLKKDAEEKKIIVDVEWEMADDSMVEGNVEYIIGELELLLDEIGGEIHSLNY